MGASAQSEDVRTYGLIESRRALGVMRTIRSRFPCGDATLYTVSMPGHDKLGEYWVYLLAAVNSTVILSLLYLWS